MLKPYRAVLSLFRDDRSPFRGHLSHFVEGISLFEAALDGIRKGHSERKDYDLFTVAMLDAAHSLSRVAPRATAAARGASP